MLRAKCCGETRCLQVGAWQGEERLREGGREKGGGCSGRGKLWVPDRRPPVFDLGVDEGIEHD